MLLISGFFMSTVAKGSDGPEDRRVEKHTLGGWRQTPEVSEGGPTDLLRPVNS
jgi:hypothetical protein